MISVCIATHNGEKYIKKQLESILSQLSFSDEIVISDDGSTDQTIKLIQSFEDKRIKVLTYKQHFDYSKFYLSSYYYATANFYNALKYAQGEIIFLADQDDIWVENRVSVFMEALKRADFVTSNFSIINEVDELIDESYYNENPYNNLNFIKILKNLPFRGCCFTFKRDVLQAALPFPEKLFLHDCWIGLNACFNNFKIEFIETPLLLYRRHSNNVSDLNSPNNLLFKISYRLKLVWYVLVNRLIKR